APQNSSHFTLGCLLFDNFQARPLPLIRLSLLHYSLLAPALLFPPPPLSPPLLPPLPPSPPPSPPLSSPTSPSHQSLAHRLVDAFQGAALLLCHDLFSQSPPALLLSSPSHPSPTSPSHQSLAHRLADAFQGAALLLCHSLLLASTLSPADTAALHSYACLRLLPSSLSPSSSSSSILRSLSPFRSPFTSSSSASSSPSSHRPSSPSPRRTSSSFLSPSLTPSLTPSLAPTLPRSSSTPSLAHLSPFGHTPLLSPSACPNPNQPFPPSPSASTPPTHSSPFPLPYSSPPLPLRPSSWAKSTSGHSLSTSAWGLDPQTNTPLPPLVYLRSLGVEVGGGGAGGGVGGGERGEEGAKEKGGGREEGGGGLGGEGGGEKGEEAGVVGVLRVFYVKDLTAMVVEPLAAAAGGAAREGQRRNDEAGPTNLHPELLREMEALEASLQRHHINPQAAHIQGCRYLCTDPLLRSFSASPPCKVTTLAKDSLAVLNQMRHEADRQQQRREMMRVQGGGRKRRDALTGRVGRGEKGSREQHAVSTQGDGAGVGISTGEERGSGGTEMEGAAGGASEGEQGVPGTMTEDGERKRMSEEEGGEGRAGEAGGGERERREEAGRGEEKGEWCEEGGEEESEESEEESEEVASKVGRNAWVVERRSGGRQLVVAVERGCDSLLGAEELVDRLNAQ
ncbi:unnamed protein product, partial [Closterium sp. Naga37s-1]